MNKIRTNLEKIVEKYSVKEYKQNYKIGGGLDDLKFASNRHEDAKYDEGKLTLGEATQMFAKATKLTIEEVKEVLNYAVPDMEYHHAGLLPKTHGGGMKKTYFLNSKQICDIARKFDVYRDELKLSKIYDKNEDEKERNLKIRRFNFLKEYAKKLERIKTPPQYFYQTKQEMMGRYGWFDSSNKAYKLPEFYSGWSFDKEEDYNKFLNIK